MANSSAKRGLNDGSAIYFLQKPFKLLFTWGTLLFSLIGIGVASLMLLCNKESLGQLVYRYEQLKMSANGWEQQIGHTVYQCLSWLCFDVTRIRQTLLADPGAGTLTAGFKNVLLQNYAYVQLFNEALQVVSLRIGVLIAFSFTLLLIVALLAVLDGLMARLVRRKCLRRESATLYHQAKLFRTGIVIITVMLFLAWPGYADPLALIVFLGIFAVLVRTQAKYYKKHM